MKKKQKHQWSKNDFILTFFISKYGSDGLYLRDKKEISKFIGTSVGSFTKMCSNFRHLLGFPNQLNHIKNLQWEVYEEYNNLKYGYYRNKVKDIIKQDEITRKIELEKMGIKNYRFIGKREK